MALVLIFPILLLGHLEVLTRISWLSEGQREQQIIMLLMFAVLFVTGALKRWKWRHVVIMLAAGLVGCAVLLGLAWVLPAGSGRPIVIGVAAVPFVILGIAELLLTRQRSWRGIVWMIGAAVAVAAISDLAKAVTWLGDWNISLPNRWGTQAYAISGLIDWPLTAILVWTLVPLCLRASQANPGWAVGFLFLLPCVLNGSFVKGLSLPLARQSVLGEGPFERQTSIVWLASYGSDADMDALWRELEASPWRYSSYRQPLDGKEHWQAAAIAALAARDAAGAAQRLSVLLRQKPSVTIAEDSAAWFARQQRYETVPLLVRYALAENSTPCTDALEKMELPVAALAIMRNHIVFEVRLTGRAPVAMPQSVQQQLYRLLGRDVGPKPRDWFTLYDTVIDSLPTPLPKNVQEETTRVVAAIASYWKSSNEWARVCIWRAQRMRLSDRDRQAEAEKLRDMIQPPDWDVVTTEQLEREVDSFARRVAEAVERLDRTPVSSPAGSDDWDEDEGNELTSQPVN